MMSKKRIKELHKEFVNELKEFYPSMVPTMHEPTLIERLNQERQMELLIGKIRLLNLILYGEVQSVRVTSGTPNNICLDTSNTGTKSMIDDV